MYEKEDLEKPSKSPWNESIVFVLFMLALMGPFGLSFLYKSSKFNHTAKVIITVVIIGITIYAIKFTVQVTQGTMNQYQALFGS